MITGLNSIKKLSLIFVIATAILIAVSFNAYAVSAPSATGYVKSTKVNVRKSASTSSKIVTKLKKNSKVTIHKEVFKSSTSTAAKNKWYYVSVNGKKGYIRSNNIKKVSYGNISARTTKKAFYRKGAGTKFKKKGTIKKGKYFTVLLEAKPVSSAKGSSSKWYKAKIGNKICYICSSNVKLGATYVNYASGKVLSAAEFETYMSQQGFPESYKTKLRTLHKAHPNWGYVAYNTGISWDSALTKESKSKVSLIHKSYPKSYRNGSKQIEPGWYNANSKVVAYYMDPRNFLNENSIYMFEDLSYKPVYQTEAVVRNILAPSKLPTYGFTAGIFVKAGAKTNVSPVFLAARARQETGSGSDAITGKTSLGKVYNPFNIGAYGGTNPLYNGLLYAKAKGWNTPSKAVEGGAALLAESYISKGQHTTYYQRFNVRNGASKVATHQYMTNIMAAYSESLSTKNSYKSYGVVNQPLIFEIPIYNSMPSSTKLP